MLVELLLALVDQFESHRAIQFVSVQHKSHSAKRNKEEEEEEEEEEGRREKGEGRREISLALVTLNDEWVVRQVNLLILEVQIPLACQMLFSQLQLGRHLMSSQTAFDLPHPEISQPEQESKRERKNHVAVWQDCFLKETKKPRGPR